MKKTIINLLLLVFGVQAFAQNQLSLSEVLRQIESNHPQLKMYEAQIRASDEAAKGAFNWMPPELSSGFFMTPYNPKMWKASTMNNGMGNYMIGVQQMLPNRKMQNAESNYMQAMSSVQKEEQKATLNDLYAAAKKSYYQWVVNEKKLAVLNESEKILDFMIKNAEIRYKNGLGKINAYYKAKASLGSIENMRVMMESDNEQMRIMLNTLMNRDKNVPFSIDTSMAVKNLEAFSYDTAFVTNNRSDLKAIERNMQLNQLQQQLERAKLKPEFGVSYNHMFAFGNNPNQFSLMAMVRLPMARWSSKANRANIESLHWQNQALEQQRQSLINEIMGQTSSTIVQIKAKKKQMALFENNILPALRNNYKTLQLAYEQNTEELFMLYDAWESLYRTQLDYLDQWKALLVLQAELERELEIK